MASASVSGFKQYPLPVGVIIPFAGLVKPAGYLLCDGSAYLQSDYPELFRVLDGIGYGQNATQFNTPSLVGSFIQGTLVNSASAFPASGGGDTVTFQLVEDNMPDFVPNTLTNFTPTSFSTSIPSSGLITNNSGLYGQSGGSPTETFLQENQTNHPLGSISINITSPVASYTGTGLSQSVPLTAVVPSSYTLGYYIRATY
jgi:microcystin-dependent protein